MRKLLIILIITLSFGCKPEPKVIPQETDYLKFSKNILDYRITPKDCLD